MTPTQVPLLPSIKTTQTPQYSTRYLSVIKSIGIEDTPVKTNSTRKKNTYNYRHKKSPIQPPCMTLSITDSTTIGHPHKTNHESPTQCINTVLKIDNPSTYEFFIKSKNEPISLNQWKKIKKTK
jgi:hypothetical protein